MENDLIRRSDLRIYTSATEEQIAHIPAVDAVGVRHAEWKYEENYYDDGTYFCSVCHEPWTLIAGTPAENNMNYCPNCGARMDGSREDGDA